MQRFSELYNMVCRYLFGRNYHRETFDRTRPLAIGCIDCNGTRYWKSMGSIENVHIHSIWMSNPTIREKFSEMWSDGSWIEMTKERLDIRELDVRRWENDTRDRSRNRRVTSYASKFIGHNQNNLEIPDDFRIYPTRNGRAVYGVE